VSYGASVLNFAEADAETAPAIDALDELNFGFQHLTPPRGQALTEPSQPSSYVELVNLIAKLAAKRWYRMQAEQQATSITQADSKDPSCKNIGESPTDTVPPSPPQKRKAPTRKQK